MKRFSKMLALGMALSLVFGMTAFAAVSVTVESAGLDGNTVAEGIFATVEIGEGEAVSISSSALESEQKEELLAAIDDQKEDILDALSVEDGSKVTLTFVKAFDANVTDGDLTGPVILTIASDAFVAGEKYIVIHVPEEGDAEYKIVTASAGKIEVELSSLSPIAVMAVNVTEPSITTPTTPTNPSGTGNTSGSQSSSQSTTPKSPQTGETLPIAGIMALICLAGAGICAGKVRYNKQ